jgi:hypothetical protein
VSWKPRITAFGSKFDIVALKTVKYPDRYHRRNAKSVEIAKRLATMHSSK